MKRSRMDSLFPLSLFFLYLVVLLLMSGVHTGLIILANEEGWSDLVQISLPFLYWAAVAAGLTFFTRKKMIQTYDRPMKELARAAGQVAQGDFSVYIPPIHTADRYDYLDRMILDFNQMVAELGSLETMRTDFIANVSHEFKTPLAAIQNYAQLLEQPGLSPKEQRACTAAILGSTRRLSALVTNILKLNKLESQQLKPQPVPYDLCRQLSDCALAFEPVWEEKQIEFDASLEDRTVIQADASLLELVWNNLLSNAFKFTPPGGRVTLTQSCRDGWAVVTVADTGCGISPQAQKHIFDKFYQADPSHASAGNGLGLALVRRVLERTGGRITVDSAEGRGSAFTVQLPLGTSAMQSEDTAL
ncbi:HAMP domain-containing sensor histidine kinase [Faecalibacterium sp. An121]|uniref:HAMP domain-containing sensor histidine kinase n=1 Tax=Faecalibacterium sp. An121 TaxID=1965550 RepID=UPI000B38B9DB|nr:HAMP domain-containing sensor histidine kinase [Faecalibacterium sp. An121]OUQ38049.1 two-component sensor histidine kinase [Faecalibacterium sp. An121]